MVRKHVVVSGRVQGVCFRMETKRVADKNSVSGWVRNRVDGSVEAVFQGKEESVNCVLVWCRSGPIGATVRDMSISEDEIIEELSGFEIRY